LARARPPAPAGRRRRTSLRACAPWQVLRPSRFAPPIADHAFDLQRHGQRPEIFRLGELDRCAAPGPAHGADEVEGLELPRIVLVDEQVLDEGRLAVPDRLTVR